jgi:hypothetical protein
VTDMTDWNRLINKEVVIQTKDSKYFAKVIEITEIGDGGKLIGFVRRDNNKFILLRDDEIKKAEEL